MEKVEVYLKAQQQKEINVIKVKLADICQVWCGDEKYMSKINNLVLYEFKPREEKRTYKKVFSILDIIDKINRSFPEVTVISLGEAEFVVEYTSKINESGWKNAAKIILVSILVFFGSAFTIMAFNNDISIGEVFDRFYGQVIGQKKPTVSEIEICYGLGLAVGILVFFNHVGKKKITSDPTPIQVEMRKYEKDIDTTFIENAGRKGHEHDVN